MMLLVTGRCRAALEKHGDDWSTIVHYQPCLAKPAWVNELR